MNRSKWLLAIFASFALLISGIGVASASADQPSAPAATAKVGYLTKAAEMPRVHPQSALSAVSYRALWCGVNNDFVLTLTGTGTYDGQPVAVTISEQGTGGVEFIGAARMHVNNVVVQGGNIVAWVTVEWGTPLCVYTHYISAG